MEKRLPQDDIIDLLFNEYKKEQSSIILIKGERGSGKTHLIKQFIKLNGIKPLYYEATIESDKGNRDNFRNAVLRFNELPCFKTTDFTWELSFKCFMSGYFKEKRVIILDDIHQLIKANFMFPKMLLESYLKHLQHNNVLLILTSEEIDSYVEEIFRYETFNSVSLQPLLFNDFKDYYSSNQEILYTLTDGLFYNMQHFDNDNYIDTIKETFLNKNHIMFEKPYYDLLSISGDGIKKQLVVLKAVAKGYHHLEDLVEYLKLDKVEIVVCLNRLIELNVIKKDPSINGILLSKNYRTRYIFTHSSFACWLLLNYSNRYLINDGLIERIDIENEIKHIVQEVYIKICYQTLKRLNLDYKYTAKYYEDNMMIDLISVDTDNKKIILGNCELTKNKKGLDCYYQLLDLFEKYVLVKYKGYTLDKIVIFSEKGFKDELIKLGENSRNVILLSNKKS